MMKHPGRWLPAGIRLVSCGWLWLSSAGSAWLGAAQPDRVLVGANYFAGWWESLPNKWHGHGWSADEPDWRAVYPERDPLLGAFNDQATMDREIAAAAEHGVDFFSILWYFPAPGSKHEADARRLNRGLTNFLGSPNAPRLRFMVEYCNHPSFSAVSEENWACCLKTWGEALRHPSYLRVGGRLVFKVHDAHQFWLLNGRDVDRCRERLAALRRTARDAGLGEMLIGGGIVNGTPVTATSFLPKLFDFTATYMGIPAVEIQDAELPYRQLAAEARAMRPAHAADPIPWVPYLPAGWNPRPWTHPQADPNHRRFFQFPSREEWTAELVALQQDFVRLPSLGLPLPDGRRQPVVTIYAWNEFGEGGILAPTQGEGAMKLEAIRQVFGR